MESDVLGNFDLIFKTEGRALYAEHRRQDSDIPKHCFFKMVFYCRTAWDTAVDARQADPRRRLLSGMSQL
jgi:hypothetical protein